MVRIPRIRDWLLDEAEGFLLEHALIAQPQTWPPLPATQSDRLTQGRKKMDWEGEVRDNPDDPPTHSHSHAHGDGDGDGDGDANKERCVICLMALRDRTIVGVCGHEFCFECIGVWANQSRRCPLCSAEMAPFLLHDLDSTVPTKFYLPPLPQLKLPSASSQAGPSRQSTARWGKQRQEMDELDHQVERRMEIYRHGLFVKHIGSNPITRFIPNPTPRQISDDPVLLTKATMFLRRELRIWSLVDVEVLTGHILTLIKAIDIRSEPAVRLLGELLDCEEYPRGAEQFAHELYTWLRSPFKDLRRYDEIAQYDKVPVAGDRSRSPSRSRSQSRSRSRSFSSESFASRSLSPLSSRSRSPSPRPRTRLPPKKWNEPDTWLDPEYEAWLESDKKRHQERMEARRRRSEQDWDRGRDRGTEQKPMRSWGNNIAKVELLPSPPPASLRMETESESTVNSIKGAAKEQDLDKRKKLLERLAKAKAQLAPLPLVSPAPAPTPSIDVGETKRARLTRDIRSRIQLKIKLESEKKQFRTNINESKAQELRRKLLEAKAKREAEETDLVLKRLDMIDRKREVRRRLMVLKMMAAETDQERRARELREKLVARKAAGSGQGIRA